MHARDVCWLRRTRSAPVTHFSPTWCSDENATPSTSANSTPLRRSSNHVPPQSPYAQASPYTPRTHVLRKGTSSKRIAAWMESWTGDIEQQLKQDLQAFLIRFFSYVTHDQRPTTNDTRPNHTKGFACLRCAADSLSTLATGLSCLRTVCSRCMRSSTITQRTDSTRYAPALLCQGPATRRAI